MTNTNEYTKDLKSQSNLRAYLIVGVGEVGLCIAEKLLASQASIKLHVHTLSEQSMNSKIKELKLSNNQRISGSFGNIFSTKYGLSQTYSNEDERELNYLYAFSKDWHTTSMIYELIKKVQPDYIIDTIALAAQFTQNFSYELFHSIKNDKIKSSLITDFLLKNPIASLSNYVQSLSFALKDHNVKSYTKVSSSGLGGMGFNCPYTHGSKSSYKLTPALEHKIAAVGIMQQLLWNLADSSSSNINLIVPKALIGLDLPFIKEIKEKKTVLFKENNSELLHKEEITKSIPLACIPCGDSTYYSIQEVLLASNIGQLEIISKEEVANVAIQSLTSKSKYNLLEAMNKASLYSTRDAYIKKEHIVKNAQELETKSYNPSIVTGNLGCFISKFIAELYLIKQANQSKKSITQSEECHLYIKNNSIIRDQILLAELTIKTDKGEWYLLKNQQNAVFSTEQEIVDLRSENINKWNNFLKSYFGEKSQLSELYDCFSSLRVGEIVAAYIASLGFQRQKQRKIS